jgi:hypothetical protein
MVLWPVENVIIPPTAAVGLWGEAEQLLPSLTAERSEELHMTVEEGFLVQLFPAW